MRPVPAAPAERIAQIAFDTITIEGALLSADTLTRVAHETAGAQTPADYRIPPGLTLRDEIARAWRIAQAGWARLATARTAVPPDDAAAQAAPTRRFVETLLRDGLGFGSLAPIPPVVRDDRTFPLGLAALGGRVPVVVAPTCLPLDDGDVAFGADGRRRSAFGLVQDYLNADPAALWGIACNGRELRLVRDNASLTRPAWVEIDLERLFTGDRFADFAVAWLLLHETRFGRADAPPQESPLETWRIAGLEEGTRAREHLRAGVEEALLALGQGFLGHPANEALRAALRRSASDGGLPLQDYLRELLRLVYRLIFLLTIEERGLLHPDGVAEDVRGRYADGYAVTHLRTRALRRSAHDRHGDLWQALTVVLRGLASGEPRLGLPALGGLFAADRCAHLDACALTNAALLQAVFRLTWLRQDGALARVNWRDMGPEELGSVYEGLLELVPQLGDDGRAFAFAARAESRGNQRKQTGSYYTPDSLVQALLDSALEPVIQRTLAAHPTDAAAAFTRLTIVDPACGSGHFLLAAARRLASAVARAEADGTPTAKQYRHALRQVVGRCLYGVDLNPLAIELCQVSLWLESLEPGMSLAFLDAHLRCGNSLIGATPAALADGVPDDAYKPLPGDDAAAVAAQRRLNRQQRAAVASGQQTLLDDALGGADPALVAQAEDADDRTLTGVHRRAAAYRSLDSSEQRQRVRWACDAWVAAFVAPRTPTSAPITTATIRLILARGVMALPTGTADAIGVMRAQYRPFHWHLEFPRVFADGGGFDVVLGNPPWERVKLSEQEFFASRQHDAIATAATAAARRRLIDALEQDHPRLYADYRSSLRLADGASQVLRTSGLYPCCGGGDVNTYAVFAELNARLLKADGRAGFIVPSGIATDDGTKAFFQLLVDGRRLVSLYDFENRDAIFPSVHRSYKFCLLTIAGTAGVAGAARFRFFATAVTDLTDPTRLISLTPEDIARINPNTKTCPIFRTPRDAAITRAIYRRVPIFLREAGADGQEVNPWGVRFATMFHMSNDSSLFRTRPQLTGDGWRLDGNRFRRGRETMAPLYEAKLFHHFDHRWATFVDDDTTSDLTDGQRQDPTAVALPRYWVACGEVDAALDGSGDGWSAGWLLAFRDIARATDERTALFTVVPRVAVGNSAPLALLDARHARLVHCLAACMSSLCLDFAARLKVGGTHLNFFIVNQLPVLAPQAFAVACPWDTSASVEAFIRLRVLELAYTAWDLAAFAAELGYDGTPFRWEPERRAQLRAELDAAFFHLYGIGREDTDYILDTFPIVRRNDEAAHGEYRTKRLILEAYDAMAAAASSGRPYVTPIDPPPADRRQAHPDDPASRARFTAPTPGGATVPTSARRRPARGRARGDG